MTTRVALITGCGKRDGMGRAIATTLAASGVAVAVTDKQLGGVLNRRQEIVGAADDGWRGVDSLVDEITAAGGAAMSQLGDISVEAAAVSTMRRRGEAGSTSWSTSPRRRRAWTGRTSKRCRSRSGTW